jgi:hypothetical protein
LCSVEKASPWDTLQHHLFSMPWLFVQMLFILPILIVHRRPTCEFLPNLKEKVDWYLRSFLSEKIDFSIFSSAHKQVKCKWSHLNYQPINTASFATLVFFMSSTFWRVFLAVLKIGLRHALYYLSHALHPFAF